MRITTILLIALPFLAAAQTGEKPGKLRYQSGFFTAKWELGDNSVKQKAVGLHLEKYSPKAATEFAFMRRAQKTGLVWDIITSVGILGAAFGGDAAFDFAAVGLVGCTGLVVCSINDGKHRKRAIKTYNTAYGY